MIPTTFPPSPLRLVAFCALALAATAPAQQDEPPWWLVADNETVSAAWEFTTQPPAGQPIAPTQELGPAWYPGSAIQVPQGMTWQANLTNHQGVMVYNAQAFAQAIANIGNDPRPNWIKMMWLQFDVFETAPRAVEYEIASSPNYTRHNVKVDVTPLGQGWSRVTIDGQLRPQPVGEDFVWDFLPGSGALALDNVYVNTRCIPLDNELPEGDALGEPTGYLVDVTAATGNSEAFGCAYTNAPATGEVFWVSARAPQTPGVHQFFGFDANTGALLFNTTQNVTTQDTPTGLLDLAAADIRGGGLFVFGGFVNAQGFPEFRAWNPRLLSWIAARTIVVPALAGLEPRGLAFNPDGDRGTGTLWMGDQLGNVHEIDLAGNVLRTASPGAATIRGAGYDPIRGELYWLGRSGSLDPRNIEAVGVVFDVRNLQPTGARFFGSFAGASTTSPTGRALGLDVFRKPSPRQARIVGLADRGASDVLYELHATYRYGLSCRGELSMNFRAPFLGTTAAPWQVTLSGAPPGALAVLYLGFSKTNSPTGIPLPFSLVNFGFPECAIVQSLDLDMGIDIVSATGRAAVGIPLPNLPGLSQTPTYWQWVMFGNQLPGGLATSPGAKTILY